jgi:Glycosyltransferase family 9 (heptosyltransferase)/Tetratricopeptide repeat
MIEAPLIAPPEDGKFIPTAHRFFLSSKAYYERGNIGAAEHCLVSALRLDPNHHAALTSLACIVQDRRQFDAALALAQRAVNLEPRNPAYLGNLGNALFRCDRYQEAAAAIMQAIGIANERQQAGEEVNQFGLAGLWHNLGLARIAAGRPDQAVQCFRTALALAPQESRIRRDLGIALLGSGQFGEGLIAHEARWDELQKNPVWDSGIPRWEGEDLAGKTIIVHHEQGFGDTLQFCRFLPWLRERGARVIVAVPQPLLRLMAISGLADGVCEVTGPPPPADYHSPMMSVPAHLGVTLETIPGAPYLRAPEAGLGIPVMKPDGVRLMVGVVWAGSSGYVPDMRRSMPFPHVLRLVDIPELGFVSLQKGDRAADIAAHGARSLIGDLSGLLGDFADTAAALMQVDIVVSVDTAVLHLAGALGRPTIALLSNWRCWRWLTGRDDTPWYPSMRLVTQETPGDWPGVMAMVRQIILDAEIEEEVTMIGSSTIEPAAAA